MDPAIVSALAAVLGSLAGGSATVAAGRVAQRTQGRRELVQADIREREQLDSAFVGLSTAEICALVKTEDSDPMRALGAACRAEFEAMRARF